MTPARLLRVLLPVDDIDGAARFYAAVLGQPGERVSRGRHYFDCDGAILACYDARADGDDAPARPGSEPVYLTVDDLDGTYDACRAAGASLDPGAPPDVGPLGRIHDRPWGERSFYAHDPFGNALCFVARGTEFRGGTSGV